MGWTWKHFMAIPLTAKPEIVRGESGRGHSRRIGFVRFSNRPFGVKRFQTTHHHSVDVAHGLVLLLGVGTKALPSWDSKTRWNNLSGGLAVQTDGSRLNPLPPQRPGRRLLTWR